MVHACDQWIYVTEVIFVKQPEKSNDIQFGIL